MSKPLAQPLVVVPDEHVCGTRGSGFSTVIALSVLANAIANPGTKYQLKDHFPTASADNALAELVRSMRNALGLRVSVSKSINNEWMVEAEKVGVTEPTYVRR